MTKFKISTCLNAKKTDAPTEKTRKPSTSVKKGTKVSNDVFGKILNKTSELTNTGVELGKIAASKVDESAKIGISKAKSNSTIQDIVKKASETIQTSAEKSKESSTRLKKIQESSLGAFEQFVGTIRKGTQYGKTSIEMLGDLAKMKELGIISEEEFEAKKKQIMRRI